MRRRYDHKEVEARWATQWKEAGIYRQVEAPRQTRGKCYVLDMFPYPSGEGLHVGHPKGYIATDIYSRFKKMNGFSILHPMGWDAFGLPAENYAIKNKVHPRVAVEKNIATFKAQLDMLGLNYDWEREINTTDPAYYRWTQWIFLKLFEKGLAYESNEPINWCPSCQTGLANEDLENGRCERCGSVVEKRPMRQWVLKITQYAERLLKDLDMLTWPESIKESQRNWIGKSDGALIKFKVQSSKSKGVKGDHEVEVFTTRPDTLFGATFVAIAPELAQKWLDVGWQPDEEVKKYIAEALTARATQTYKDNPEKTGIFSGVYAVNPANNEDLPVWVVNYVLADVGTGAIMAVPAHDERDYEFAQKYNLPISDAPLDNNVVNTVGAKIMTTYRLKDWVFSRQRYWGEPIPVVHCEKCGVVPVPEKDLPVTLPEVEHYEPTGTGESPLANISEWVNTTCPTCGGPAKRETNTMPQWAGSSWYYLRYADPHNDGELASKDSLQYWCNDGVDMYVGGTEHATRHLIYARFWHKFLFDIGVVSNEEPFRQLRNQGLILGSDGKKMSKRFGNVVNPDEMVEKFGADTMRVYEMFMGPFEDGISWSTDNMVGSRRFLEKVWRIAERVGSASSQNTQQSLHQCIKKVGEDIEAFKFNTAISQMMITATVMEKEEISRDDFQKFLIILSPFAPHICQELWQELGGEGFIYEAAWPAFDPHKVIVESVTIAIQINGKVRDEMEISLSSTESELLAEALEREKVKTWLGGKAPTKVHYVSGRVLNIVT